MDSISEFKKLLRRETLKKREALGIQRACEKSSVIMKKLMGLPEFKKAKFIMCYLDFRNEVATADFINKCLQLGKRVAVPLITTEKNNEKTMHACEVENIDRDLDRGNFGILEPITDRPVDAALIDMAVIPGVGFDMSLNRLGFGKGFYDRFMPLLRNDCLKAGIAYDIQIVDKIPVSEFDFKMDLVITESKVIGKVNFS
jgi:5-formyltetrahydrofolate cyclo-ligase